MSMSTTVCRYSRNCRRPDCYFAHPEGRFIESNPGGGRANSPQHHHDQSNSHAHNGVGHKNPTPCRFDRQCKRPECYFAHPNGRDIDDAYYAGQHAPHQPSPPTIAASAASSDSSDPTSPSNAMNRSFEQFVRHHEEERQMNETMMENLEDSDRQDDWIPASRDCACCKGYAYGCKDPTCQSLGVCGCIAEAEGDDDEDDS
eukprot:TRINITY_DN8311_c0_g1_i1.p1 TRINITY_DN8311_c0_g1~~TRINITY_DN8311_c0_g1_i1.p1  ORF type:complete len:201 (-),score=36.99 TRINITY_DN8311_c0_g1_i1:486-1088(-)